MSKLQGGRGDVRAEVDDNGVGRLCLSRPDRLNAVTGRTFLELEQSARWLGAQPGCRAIVLLGEGRSFCAGLDLDLGLAPDADPQAAGRSPWDHLSDPVERNVAALRSGVAAIRALREIPQPVVASVRGHAVGAGFALAAAADIRVCAPDARFSAVFVRLGVSAGDLGLSWFLPRIIGHPRAAELLLTGASLNADEALAHGLATHVVDEPDEFAVSIAAQIAALAPYGVTATKSLLNASRTSDLHAHLDAELAAQIVGLTTQAHVEAKRAARAHRLYRSKMNPRHATTSPAANTTFSKE